jgi:hypothetical protein
LPAAGFLACRRVERLEVLPWCTGEAGNQAGVRAWWCRDAELIQLAPNHR